MAWAPSACPSSWENQVLCPWFCWPGVSYVYDITVKRAEYINKSTEIWKTSPLPALWRFWDLWKYLLEICMALTCDSCVVAWPIRYTMPGTPTLSWLGVYHVAPTLTLWTECLAVASAMWDQISCPDISSFSSLWGRVPLWKCLFLFTLWPLVRDVRTITRMNVQHVQDMTGLDPWSCLGSQVRKVLDLKLAEMPQQDEWRLPYLGKRILLVIY